MTHRLRRCWKFCREHLLFIKIFLHRAQVARLIPAGFTAARVHPQFSQVDCSLAVRAEFTGRGSKPTKTGKFLLMVNIARLIPCVNLLT